MSVKVVYQDIAPGAAEDAAVSATSVDTVSDISLIPFGGDRGRYATFEPNWWVLDGTVDLYDGQEVAYVSSVVSDENGSFGGENLYDPSTRIDGYYINNGGQAVAEASCSYSAAIPVEYGKTYTFSGVSGKSGTNNKRVKWYINDDPPSTANVISSPDPVAVVGIGVPYSKTFTVWDNRARFMRISFNTADTNVAVVEGSSPLTEEGPTITVEFDNTYTSLGVYLEQAEIGYCDLVNVKWYAGGTLLDNKDYTPDGPDYFCENTVNDYDKVVFTFKRMTHPGRKLRISRILFGIIRTFERDELRTGSAKIVQQIDNTSRELPTNTLDFKLSSKENVEYIFQTKQQMAAYDGNTLIGVFYVDDSNRQAENIYDITCVDAIGVLEDDAFPDTYYNGATAISIAEAICGEFEVDMQADLQSKTLTGILYQQNRRTALQQLCFALGAVADTSGTDKIKIFTLDTPTPIPLDEHRLRPGGSVNKAAVVTAVKVAAHTYSTSGSGSGIVINGVTYYDTTTVTTLVNPAATASDKANVIEVSDCTLISSANVADIAQHLLDEVTRRNTHRVQFRLDGEEPGDYVQTITPWGTNFLGHYISGSIILSGFALSDAEVIED